MVGFKEFRYGLLDYDNLMESRGLKSPHLKYNPFRDDGKLIWTTLQSFSRQFTNMYYKDDWDVLEDAELQSFAAQVRFISHKICRTRFICIFILISISNI